MRGRTIQAVWYSIRECFFDDDDTQSVTCNRYLRDRHEARDRLRRIGREIGRKRIGIHGEEAVAY
jgi:hypothetical protein